MADILSRLQSATGPNRELDAEIALANGWEFKEYKGKPYWRKSGSIVWSPQPPCYTESIDAKLPCEDIIGTSEQSARPGQPIKWMAIQRMQKGRMPVSAIAHTEAIARRLAYMMAKENSKS